MESLFQLPLCLERREFIGHKNSLSNLDVSRQVYNFLGNVRIECREALNKKSAEEIRKISLVNKVKFEEN